MSIKKTIREFFDPRFSTEEVENSKLKCNLPFESSDMFYDDLKRGYPTTILGAIKTPAGILMQVSWNQHGECTNQGVRLESFDMVRPTQKEIDSARPILVSSVVIFFAGVIYAIF